MDIMQQQVLDNVAMFAVNADTLPSFATIADGATQSQDGGFVQPQFIWNATAFTGLNFPFNAQRQLVENWKLQPVMSAGRLRRIRCAFQMLFVRATITIGDDGKSVLPAEGCVKCVQDLVNVGALPKPSSLDIASSLGDKPTADGRWLFATEDGAIEYAQKLQAAMDCALPSGWFCTGAKAPKDACVAGEYCGTYVWVAPGGYDAFSRFTMTVMLLATVDPAPPRPGMDIYFKQEQKKANVKEALAPLLGTNGEIQSFWGANKLPNKALQDVRRLLEKDDLTNIDLIELRSKLGDLSKEARKEGANDEVQSLIQRGEAAIDYALSPPSLPPTDPYDLPGTLPLSRGGGVEYAPALMGAPQF